MVLMQLTSLPIPQPPPLGPISVPTVRSITRGPAVGLTTLPFMPQTRLLKDTRCDSPHYITMEHVSFGPTKLVDEVTVMVDQAEPGMVVAIGLPPAVLEDKFTLIMPVVRYKQVILRRLNAKYDETAKPLYNLPVVIEIWEPCK